MATAKFNYVERSDTEINLKLTLEEAAALRIFMGQIVGSGKTSIRKFSDNIYEELTRLPDIKYSEFIEVDKFLVAKDNKIETFKESLKKYE